MLEFLKKFVRIDPSIRIDEKCARFLKHPFCFNKNGSVKPNAFEPAQKSKDVSLARMRYLSSKECQAQGDKICSPYPCYGYAIITPRIIRDLSEAQGLKAEIRYSPMDENNNYIEDGRKLTMASPGVPFHAGLEYPELTIEPGEPCQELRKYTKALVDKATLIMK